MTNRHRLYVLELECPRCRKLDNAVVKKINPLPEYACKECAAPLLITGCEVENDLIGRLVDDVFEGHLGWTRSLDHRSTKQ